MLWFFSSGNREPRCPRCREPRNGTAAKCVCGYTYTDEADRLDAASAAGGKQAAVSSARLESVHPSSGTSSGSPLPLECSECGVVNREGASYCRSCGTSLHEKTCAQCNSVIPAMFKFCDSYGAANKKSSGYEAADPSYDSTKIGKLDRSWRERLAAAIHERDARRSFLVVKNAVAETSVGVMTLTGCVVCAAEPRHGVQSDRVEFAAVLQETISWIAEFHRCLYALYGLASLVSGNDAALREPKYLSRNQAEQILARHLKEKGYERLVRDYWETARLTAVDIGGIVVHAVQRIGESVDGEGPIVSELIALGPIMEDLSVRVNALLLAHVLFEGEAHSAAS